MQLQYTSDTFKFGKRRKAKVLAITSKSKMEIIRELGADEVFDRNQKDLEMHGATVMQVGIFEKLVSYIENGEIRPLLAMKFPISQIKKAQDAFLNKKHIGNFIILPWQ